jgi:hypothetical protein
LRESPLLMPALLNAPPPAVNSPGRGNAVRPSGGGAPLARRAESAGRQAPPRRGP